MHKTYKTYKTYTMMMGASCDTPWVCGAAVWFGPGDRFTGRLRGQIDGNGGVRVAVAWRLSLTCLTCLTCLTKRGRHGMM